MNPWILVPFVAAAGAALNGLVGVRWFGRATATAVACTAMAVSFGLSVWAFVSLVARPPDARIVDVVLGTWIPAIPLETVGDIVMFAVSWTFRLDPLGALMALIVTGVGFLIHVYAAAYMRDEPRGGYARFFCYLNLFCFFMLVLVLAGNFLVMFVGWEGVGLCSYLLIGFWYERNSAATAGRKAFIVTRVGDWGLVVGILLVFFTFGTLDFREVAVNVAALPRETAGFGVLSGICALLFMGAMGKSAQVPLHVWLPDAMEGPTPVSALIHAATMVTAGVYMIARNASLFEHAPLVMAMVATVGALTALIGATIALVQTDIKRVLAYSTMSQLGLMFVATGVGAFAAAVFHLLTHAFFKSLLFLGSGAVIQAMAGEQDMQRMGGLRKYLPVTFVTMTIGSLAIAGIPPLSGFFSKDEILLRAFAGNRMLWSVLVATSVLTALYMFRLIALTFYGAYRGAAWPEPAAPGATPWHGPREGSRAMTVPLMALAVGAIVAGFIGIPQALGGTNAMERFLAPSIDAGIPQAAGHPAAPGRALSLGLMFLSVLLTFVGIQVARTFYLLHPDMPRRIAARWHRTHALLRNGYYLDHLYEATIVRGVHAAGRGLNVFDSRVVDAAVNAAGWLAQIAAWGAHMFDRHVVDGIVGGVAWTAERGSFLVRTLQTGLIQNYALLMVLGVFAFISIYLLAR